MKRTLFISLVLVLLGNSVLAAQDLRIRANRTDTGSVDNTMSLLGGYPEGATVPFTDVLEAISIAPLSPIIGIESNSRLLHLPSQLSQPVYIGRHSGVRPGGFGGELFSLVLTPDSSTVVEIIVPAEWCEGDHTFTLTLSPGIPVIDSRFSANDVPVAISSANHTHMLDIDGVFFDADGDGTKEQALGGFSFVSGLNRCIERWSATTVQDNDNDGWGDFGERRLGSERGGSSVSPEHILVPTTTLYGPDHCNDLLDNDLDNRRDAEEEDGPDSDPCPDCLGALPAPSTLIASVISSSQINLTWVDKSDNEIGFAIERKAGEGAFSVFETVDPDVTSYEDIDVVLDTVYTYRVRATGANSACLHSNYSNDAVIMIRTSVEVITDAVPASYELGQNYPNPFNPTTTIRYALPGAVWVTLRVYDVMGREVITLVDERFAPGTYEVSWDGRTALGKAASSGVYLYRIEAGSFVGGKQMTLLR